MGLCNGSAFLDTCGICSGGLTGHQANSDLDCLGVCFGNYTENCLLEMRLNSTEIDAIIDLTKSETETIVQFEIANECMYLFSCLYPFLSPFRPFAVLIDSSLLWIHLLPSHD